MIKIIAGVIIAEALIRLMDYGYQKWKEEQY